MLVVFCFFFFNDTATTEIYTLSLHDALPILVPGIEEAITDVELAKEIGIKVGFPILIKASAGGGGKGMRIVENVEELPEQMERAISRSEEHTSELQSPCNLVCRLLLEKKKKKYY